MPFRLPALPSICLLLAATAASAAETERNWYTVLLDGRKIGQFESVREAHRDRVVTTQSLDIVLDRAGMRLALGSSERAVETREGAPLSFRNATSLAGSESVTEGRVRDGRIELTTTTGGVSQTRSIPWPDGALLAEGQRLAAMRAGLAPGTRFSLLAFQPSSVDAFAVDTSVGATETVELPGGQRRLHRVEQTMALPGAPMTTTAWVDDALVVHKLTMPLMGVELTLLACDERCATAPNQTSDVFDRTMAASPRALGMAERQDTLRYVLSTSGTGNAFAFPQTDEQSVRRDGTHWIVTVAREPATRSEEGPEPSQTQPGEWLQSDATEIVALMKRATTGVDDPAARMLQLETFVRDFIHTKSLGVGYASALDVARDPQGDCTEHALLLAALGRAAGIPTRVVTGLAYAPAFAGKNHVFVPHAWMQAWVDGHWRSYDAALDGFDAGHIALAVGDGDPWKFYSGLDLLGTLRLESVQVPARATP